MNQVFTYTIYIKSTTQKVWDAITLPEFTKQYWAHENISDWNIGSDWKHVRVETGNTNIFGQVLESSPPNLLKVSWAGPSNPDDISEVTYEIKQLDETVQLNVTHINLSENMGKGVIRGWPVVLSSLKSFLETGSAIDTMTTVRKA